jgi:signal transduction histidine kinase
MDNNQLHVPSIGDDQAEQYDLLSAMHDITIALNSTLKLDLLLDLILSHVGRVVPHDTADVMLIAANEVKVVESRGYVELGHSSTLGLGFLLENLPNLCRMVETRRPLIIPHVHDYPDWVDIPESRWIHSYVGAPIIVQDEIVGFINLNSARPGFFNQTHAQRLQSFANQAGIALRNAHLLEAERKQRRLAETLGRVGLALNSTLDLSELLNLICRESSVLFQVDAAFVWLVQGDELVGFAGYGVNREKIIGIRLPLTDSRALGPRVVREKHPIFINKARSSNRLNQALVKLLQVEAILGVPLIKGEQVLGVLMLIDTRNRQRFNQEDLETVIVLSNYAAIAVQNAQQFEAERRQRELAETLREATIALTSPLDLWQVLDILLIQIERVIPYDSACVFLLQEQDAQLKAVAGRGFSKPETVIGQLYSADDELSQELQRSCQPIALINPAQNRSFRGWGGTSQIQSWLGIPMIVQEKVIGHITLDRDKAVAFDQAQIALAQTFATQAAIAIQKARLYEEVQQHAAELETRVVERTFELQVLYELAQALGKATQLDEVIHLVVQHTQRALSCEVVAGFLSTAVGNSFALQASQPLPAALELELQERLTGRFSELGEQVIDKAELKPFFSKQQVGQFEPNFFTEIPIWLGETAVGLLTILPQKKAQLNPEQKRLLQIIANQAAETIGRLQLILAAEHQRLESLVAHLPNGVVLLDAEWHIVLANQMAKELIAAITHTQPGDKLTHLGQAAIDFILEIASTASPFTIEVPGLPSRQVEITANPITAGAEAGGWTLVIRDVTEERLTQKLIQQQERMAAVGQLAAGIAHDFNNILTSIIGFAELLYLDPNLSMNTKGDVERIIKQGQRAAHLVRQILDFGRRTISDKRPQNLLLVIKEFIKLWERTIPEDILIDLEAELDEYQIKADIIQLQQALTNLAVNARDAMPAGGRLRFQLTDFMLWPDDEPPCRGMPAGAWVKLAIADTGTGIRPEHLDKIFEPFFTTKEVGEGTGLGLAQVYGIVQQHDGFIDVRSQVGRGTTFMLYFPATASITQAPPEMAARLEMPQGNQELILLVEDNVDVLNITTAMLKYLGYRVLTATNGLEALAIYDQYGQDIALVLSDMTMPKMGGAELVQALHQRDPQVKVIILTGYPLGLEEGQLPAGCVNWVQKPPMLKQLAQVMHRLIKAGGGVKEWSITE